METQRKQVQARAENVMLDEKARIKNENFFFYLFPYLENMALSGESWFHLWNKLILLVLGFVQPARSELRITGTRAHLSSNIFHEIHQLLPTTVSCSANYLADR
jgi:hypothetical protein